jgi:hypothetical protein
MVMVRLDSRPKKLKSAILNFLENDWDSIGQKIISSPYVKALKKKPDGFPSKIPANAFAQSIIDIIKEGDELPENVSEIRTKIKSSTVITGEAETWVLGVLDQSYGKVENFYHGLESAYDDAMDRVKEWYTHQAKKLVFWFGLVLAIILNVDSINIVKSLWNDEAKAKELAMIAGKSFDNIQQGSDGFVILDSKNKNDTLYQYTIATDTTTTDAVLQQKRKQLEKNLTQITATVKGLPIPIGWDINDLWTEIKAPNAFGQFSRLLGWLITAVAIYLGAPFWFDLLKNIVSVKQTVKKLKSAK